MSEQLVLAEMAREQRRRRVASVTAMVVLLTLCAAVISLSKRPAMDALTAVGMIVLAALLVRLQASLFVVPLILLASVGSTLLNSHESGWAAQIGMKCALVELVAALLPVGILFGMRLKNGDPIRVAWFAQVAGLAAVTGQLAIGLVCPSRTEAAHLWAFHTGGAALAIAIVSVAALLLRRRQLAQ